MRVNFVNITVYNIFINLPCLYILGIGKGISVD